MEISTADDMNIDKARDSILVINGMRFVSGLFWQPLSSPRNYMKEAREIGKRRKWDVVAIRKAPLRIQAGFVSKSAGATKGMYSLASSLAGVLGDQWIGAFAVGNDRYAIVAIEKGSVVPGFDAVVARDEALERLQAGINLGVFSESQIFAPRDFSFAKEEKDIASLLVPKAMKTRYKLKQLTFGLTTKELVLIIAAAVALIASAYGFHVWSEMNAKREREQRILIEQQRQKALAELNARTRREQSLAALKHPWAMMPSTTEMARVCVKEIGAMPLSGGGWLFDTASCGTSGMSLTLKRQAYATLEDLYKWAASAFPGVPVVLQDTDTASLKLPVEMQLTGDEPIDELKDVNTALRSHFQSLDTALTIKEKPMVLPKMPEPAPGEPPLPAPVPDWKQFVFEYASELNPELLFQDMTLMNGIRLVEISASLKGDVGTLNWNVKGELYAK